MTANLRKTSRKPARRAAEREAEPAWEIARLFPAQGDWTEDDYFALDSNHFVELCDGFLEFLPMPTIFHQLILQFIFKNLESFVAAGELGIVVISGYKVRLRAHKYREPDILFIKSAHQSGIKTQYCAKADLVIEIVSDKNRAHDIEKKRLEYARAGISEYWIVDPEEATITVLGLTGKRKTYVVLGIYRKGERAVSKLLPGFGVDVTEALSQQP